MPPCQTVRSSRALALAALTVTMATFSAHGFHLPITSTSTSTARLINGSPLHLSTTNNAEINEPLGPQSTQRRNLIQQSSAAFASLLLPISPAFALDDDTPTQQPSEPYIRNSSNDKFKFSYTVTPPPLFIPSNKPLKTHLDEINFSPPDIRGYTLGITIDPVRLSTIQEFGTPEEVAARVVTAEINRDGVFTVTMAKDPKEDASAGCYDIEYISDGKRGTKRFVTRIYVRDGILYVLTAQSKVAEYDEAREKDVLECVKSFIPL